MAFLMLALIPTFVSRMAQVEHGIKTVWVFDIKRSFLKFPSLTLQTVEYLRLETVGLVAGSLAKFSITAMFLNEKPVSGMVCLGFQVNWLW